MQAGVLAGNKRGQTVLKNNLPSFVVPTGIEPVPSESESEILSIKLKDQLMF
jgi:hypothetical protein